MSLKCHRMHHMCSYSMMFVQLHISIFYKFSKVTHTNLVTGSSVTKLEPFQVVAIFSSSLDLILTVAVSSSVFLSAQTTPKECNFASPPWQGTGVGDSQVTPAVAESLWAVQTPLQAVPWKFPLQTATASLPVLPFFALLTCWLPLQGFWSATASTDVLFWFLCVFVLGLHSGLQVTVLCHFCA